MPFRKAASRRESSSASCAQKSDGEHLLYALAQVSELGRELFHQKVVAGKKLPVEIPNRRVGILPHLFEGVFENQAVIALGNVLPLILHRRENAAEPHDRRRLRRVVARIYSGDRLYYGGGLLARKAERVYRVLYRKRRGLLRHNERLLPVVVAGEFFLRQSPYLVAHRGGHAPAPLRDLRHRRLLVGNPPLPLLRLRGEELHSPLFYRLDAGVDGRFGIELSRQNIAAVFVITIPSAEERESDSQNNQFHLKRFYRPNAHDVKVIAQNAKEPAAKEEREIPQPTESFFEKTRRRARGKNLRPPCRRAEIRAGTARGRGHRAGTAKREHCGVPETAANSADAAGGAEARPRGHARRNPATNWRPPLRRSCGSEPSRAPL